ncbi:MAG: GTPase ObgE [Kiritimatiellae bacterium]|nr:GTPase ObgE [Kiritimatiellia bacterium]
MKIRKFIDQVTVHVRAGKGGNGSGSFRREACIPLGGPDGGDGGRGGHVIFQGSHDVNSLINLYFAPQLFAENGVAGSGRRKYGRNGRDLIVKVPCGTELYNAETGQLIVDIVEHGQSVTVATGGKGGLGNVHFKTSTHQAPVEHTPGVSGDEFRVTLELKTIADAGLLGFPNAGKSSLLRCVSDAQPKVASYPFTTLNPIVGTVKYDDFSQLRVADVPGIIEGAAEGGGLGLRFLKHIARSTILVYVIDMAGTDNRDPWDDYVKLRREVEQYDASLLERPSIVLANKMDVDQAQENLSRFIQETGVTPIPLSTLERENEGVVRFKREIWELLRPSPLGSWGREGGEGAVEAASAAPDETLLPPTYEGEFIHEDALKHASFLDLPPKSLTKKKRRT